MKKICFLVLSLLFVSSFVYAQSSHFKAEAFKIPKFKSNVSGSSFTGIGIDGKTGNVSICNNSGWCEIPYRNGKFDLSRAFIAPTKGFKLKAVASSPNGVYVFDSLSNSIMGKTNYKLTTKIGSVSGMAYHNGLIYLADSTYNKIYEVQLANGKANIMRPIKAHSNIRGLASSGGVLYSCSSNAIYEYNSNLEVASIYKLNVSIDGITVSGRGEFLAIAKGKNVIYRFRKGGMR